MEIRIGRETSRPGSAKQERRRFLIRFRRRIRYPACGYARNGRTAGWFDMVSKPVDVADRERVGRTAGWFDMVSKQSIQHILQWISRTTG